MHSSFHSIPWNGMLYVFKMHFFHHAYLYLDNILNVKNTDEGNKNKSKSNWYDITRSWF